MKLKYLKKNKVYKFAPIDMSLIFGVTNRTIINWSNELIKNGNLKPILVNERIRNYEVID